MTRNSIRRNSEVLITFKGVLMRQARPLWRICMDLHAQFIITSVPQRPAKRSLGPDRLRSSFNNRFIFSALKTQFKLFLKTSIKICCIRGYYAISKKTFRKHGISCFFSCNSIKSVGACKSAREQQDVVRTGLSDKTFQVQ